MNDTTGRAETTRRTFLEVLERHRRDFDRPSSEAYWSESLETASRDELTAIQNDKLAALTPFLYENSRFYRRRFDSLGLLPSDIQSLDDLSKWPVVTSREMAEDAAAHPPFGTYSTMTEDVWTARGWMTFSTSGTSGRPRLFRFSHIDRQYMEWQNARALYAMDIRARDTVMLVGGFGPHVWHWGVTFALARLGAAMVPGGGLDAHGRARLIDRFRPTVLACTPSYAFHLGRVMKEEGFDPAASSVNTLFLGGEPAMGIPHTRARLAELWGARVTEFFGCTEAAPAAGGFGCTAQPDSGPVIWTHMMEDGQIWELVDPQTYAPVAPGTRGVLVCTNLHSESAPQLRFLVGDYTVFDYARCDCGRTHLRAMGCMMGRADDVINLRGIKMFPSQIEDAVRAIPGLGEEYEVVLSTDAHGLDIMTVRVEHGDYLTPDAVTRRLVDAVRAECEVRVGVEVLAPGTLAKTEFKAKRIRDRRNKTAGG